MGGPLAMRFGAGKQLAERDTEVRLAGLQHLCDEYGLAGAIG